jgi:hypothetical protein
MTSTAALGGVASGASGSGRVAVLGIRHHGPGSARSVRAELDRLRPATVLIEGPVDADPLLGLAADAGMLPPVALLAYAVDAPQISAFWPYAVFSPEWQAIRWAADHGVPVRFCDLPAGAFLAEGDTGARPETGAEEGGAEETGAAAVREDPIAQLAAAAGYDDPERWWDDVIESRLDGQPPFEALTEAMAVLREHAPEPDPARARQEARREAHMRKVLRAALRETGGTVAVVCGAWHAPALAGTLPSATADNALLRSVPKRKAALTWVPWTHSRLAAASGYGAGITSPGWYHHLFTAPDQPITRWLTRVAAVLRQHDLPVSSAHVIEAVRLADALATMRGRPLAGLGEVTEATRAVLVEGDEAALAFVTHDLVLGELLGSVPDGAPTVPLEADLRAQSRSLRLRPDPLERTLALDLRRDLDRARSALLHRLLTLGVRWGAPAADTVRGKGTFHETWTLCWAPELAVAVIDAAQWGTTVAAAAAARLTDRARGAADLAAVTGAVELALLADLPAALPELLTILDAKAAVDLDAGQLMAAVPALAQAARYGDVRGTDTSALTAVVGALTIRICAALPAAVGSLSDEAAALLRDRVDAMHAALTLHVQAVAGEPARDRWIAALLPLLDRRDVHGLLLGRIARLLLDAGVLAPDDAARRFAAHLSVGASVADKAAWAEGFLAGSGLLLIHDRDLLTILDQWVAGLSPRDFLDVLPLLRRTFSAYTAPECANLAAAVRQLATGGRPEATGAPVDEARAGGALRTVAMILAGRP